LSILFLLSKKNACIHGYGVSEEGMKILNISLKRVFLINRDGAKCHGVPQQNNKNDPTLPPA
jgi:hypothetical protein